MYPAAVPPPAQQGSPLAGLITLAVIGYGLAWITGYAPPPWRIITWIRERGDTPCPDPGHETRRSEDRTSSDQTSDTSGRPDTGEDIAEAGPRRPAAARVGKVPRAAASSAARQPDERPEVESWDDDLVIVSREHTRTWGPRPELAHLAGPHPDDLQPGTPGSQPTTPADSGTAQVTSITKEPPLGSGSDAAARRRWIRWQQRHGRNATWIDMEGSKRTGLNPKTFYRDRQAIAAREARR